MGLLAAIWGKRNTKLNSLSKCILQRVSTIGGRVKMASITEVTVVASYNDDSTNLDLNLLCCS